MIQETGKAPTPIPKTFTLPTNRIPSNSTCFSETAWGAQTRELIKTIKITLRPDSWNKIIESATDLARKTRRGARNNDVDIDLTNDDDDDDNIPDEFAMVVDLPSDDEMVVVKDEPADESSGYVVDLSGEGDDEYY